MTTDRASAATCPKYGGKVCRPEAGALCECYPGEKPAAAWVCHGDHPGVDLPISVKKGERCPECCEAEPVAANPLERSTR